MQDRPRGRMRPWPSRNGNFRGYVSVQKYGQPQRKPMNFALGGGCASGGMEVCLVIAWHQLFNPMDALWKRDAGHVQGSSLCANLHPMLDAHRHVSSVTYISPTC